jgi:poly(beta-D-mannuronate) lyase
MTLRSIAIAYLKVRNSGVVAPEEKALISAWFDDIAQQERARIETAPCAQHICVAHGHHGIGVVMAVAAVAVANGDRGLFDWSLRQYRAAIDQIDNRGMLHYDTHGQYALKFNLLSAACLVQIAELGEINGVPMYAYEHGRIALLIHAVSRGLIDSGPFFSATGTVQRVSSTIKPWEIAWASSYNRRFPDPVLTELLGRVGNAGADMWGGEPLASAMP